MRPRLLLASRDVPGWGGASTINYLLFERLQQDGFDVHCVNLLVESDAPRLGRFLDSNQGNPKGLANVHTCILRDPEWRVHENLGQLIARLQPDRVIGFGFIAAWQLHQAAPRVPLVFITSGCSQTKRLLYDGEIRDFIDFARQVRDGAVFPVAAANPERQVVEGSTYVVTHSPTVRFALERIFPAHAAKLNATEFSIADLVVAEAESFQHLRQPFAERDIDLLFIANDWSRREKNRVLMESLCERFAGRRIHIVGATPQRNRHAIHHGVLAHRPEIYALLGRARTVACPSLLDAAPGVLFEADAMGCNVVASPNCGNFDLCAPPLIAASCSVNDFATAIERSWQGEVASARAKFHGGYDTLASVLTAERL